MFQILFIVAITGVYLYTTLRYQQNKLNYYSYWFITLLALAALRYKHITGPATNQDEMQWLVSAASMRHSFSDWCTYFSSYDISRLFTLLPLLVFSPVLDLYSIASAHILSVLFAWLFTLISFRTIKLLFTRDTAIISSGLFTMMFGLTSLGDLIAYNSEYPAIALLSIALLLLTGIARQPKQKSSTRVLLLGVACSWIPFAKEQALLLAILVASIGAYQLARNKDWRALVLLATGGASGTFLALSPVILSGNTNNFLAQVQLGIEYGKQGLALNGSQPTTNKAAMMLSAYCFNADFLLPACLSLAGVVLGLFYITRTSTRDTSLARMYVYYVLVFICAAYTVYLPGNFFGHYGLLLLVPMVVFTGFVVSKLTSKTKPLLTLIALIAIHCAVGLYYGPPKPKDPIKPDAVDNLLHRYSHPGDNIVIWGWDNSLYLKYRLRRASRYLYPNRAMGNNASSTQVKDWYMQDVLHFKPRIVLELTGEDRFYFKDTACSIQNTFPALRQHLDNHYMLAGAGNNFKLYLRK